MHQLFQTKYSSWEELEQCIERISDNKEKGDAFEQFAFFYLQFSKSVLQIDEIYAPGVTSDPYPKTVVEKLHLESTDHGVDGVYVLFDGSVVAYQVKFRSNRASPTGRELSTFWAEAEYADYRCVIANTLSLPKVSGKKRNQLAMLADKLDALQPVFFEALHEYAESETLLSIEKYSPRPYQRDIVSSVISGLQENDRGKLIAACGIGKTLVSLWIKESLEAKATLFVAPTLILVRQTLASWVEQSTHPFQYICVCSDETIAKNISSDLPDIEINELDVPVTTNAQVLADQISSCNKGVVVFSTYQSLGVVAEACQTSGFEFDFTICDEAHRTAGIKSSERFSLVVDDSKIPSHKRLFMTATERLVSPNIQKRVEETGNIVFSMDDDSVYGPALYRLDFGEAIKEGIISDYRVVLAGINDADIKDYMSENRILQDESNKQVISATALFTRLLLLRCIDDLNLKKVITYHGSIISAGSFASFVEGNLDKVSNYVHEKGNNYVVDKSNNFVGHVNGSMTANLRSQVMRSFEKSDIGVITNVRCLTEGVDIPQIDAVFFSDPRSSLIDIVQAVGRAVRQPYKSKGKIAFIVVPVLVDENGIVNDERFESFFNVIQSLRDQDQSLAEWIDSLNISTVTGVEGGGEPGGEGGRIELVLPKVIDQKEFYKKIVLEIAEINKNPVGTTGIGSTLGRTQPVSYTHLTLPTTPYV